MEKFKVFQDGSNLFVDTDNYVFAESIAREAATKDGKRMIIQDTQRGDIVAYFIGKYEIYSNARGYSIRRKGRYNKWQYLKSLYKGNADFTADYTYQKHYTTAKAAVKAIEKIENR